MQGVNLIALCVKLTNPLVINNYRNISGEIREVQRLGSEKPEKPMTSFLDQF